MIKYLLDTNIVIYVMKRRPIEVLETLTKMRPAWLYLPSPCQSCTMAQKRARGSLKT